MDAKTDLNYNIRYLKGDELMELRNLQYLEAIYRTRSFTKAANELYISQPSISNGVQKLEKELHVTLIHRSRQTLTFTSEGERFMRHVYNILGAVEDAVKDMTSPPETAQPVTIAWATTLGDAVRPLLFTEFPVQYPGSQINWVEGTAEKMLSQLLDSSIDIAYALIPDSWNPDLFEVIPVQICETFACMSKTHSLADHKQISLCELKDIPIIMFPPGALIRTRLEQKFKELHISPMFHTVGPIDVIIDLLNRNYGITLLPIDRINSLSERNDLVLRPLAESVVFVKGFILKRGVRRTEAMENLINYVTGFVRNKGK